MKLTHLKNPNATVCVLEDGDGILAGGFAAAGAFEGIDEEQVIVTLTAGPTRHANDVEIYIPKRLIDKFRQAIANGVEQTVL